MSDQDMLAVKSRVYDLVPENQIGDGFFDELSEQVEELVMDAKERAEANSRTTIRPEDL